MKKNEKVIRVAIRNNDDTKVKVDFHGGVFTPEEFTSMFMAILETYTVGLLKVNSAEEVFKHFNRVFGIFLNKIVPEKEHYELDESHKKFKEMVDSTLGQAEDKKANEEIRLAALIVAREILVETGMTEESADYLINKKAGLLNTPAEKDFKDAKE